MVGTLERTFPISVVRVSMNKFALIRVLLVEEDKVVCDVSCTLASSFPFSPLSHTN